MTRACPSARRSLHLVSAPNPMNLPGSISLDAPELHFAMDMEDYSTDNHIDDLPNVTTLNRKRGPPQVQECPTKRRDVASLALETYALQPVKKSEFGAGEKSCAPIVSRGLLGLDVGSVMDRETPRSYYESLLKVVGDQKAQFSKFAAGLEEDIAQKDKRITTLQNDVVSLKDQLLKRDQDSEEEAVKHCKQIADVKSRALEEKFLSNNEIVALKAELLRQRKFSDDQENRHNWEIAAARNRHLPEKGELVKKYEREIQELKNSLQKESLRHEKECGELKMSPSGKIAAARDCAFREKQEVVKEFERQIKHLKDSLQKERVRHERECEDLKKTLKGEITDAKESALREKEEAAKEYDGEIQTLKCMLQEERLSHERECRALAEVGDAKDQAWREKEEQLKEYDRKNQDLEDSLRAAKLQQERESEELKSSLGQLAEEKQSHKEEITRLKASLKENEALTARCKRESEEDRTSFLLEKAMMEDLHTQAMSTLTTEILEVVGRRRSTNYQEGHSSVIQAAGVGTSGAKSGYAAGVGTSGAKSG